MNDLRIYILTSEDPLYSVKLVEAVDNKFPGRIVGVAFVSGLFSWKRVLWSPFIYGFGRYIVLASKVVYGAIFGGKIATFCRSRQIQVDSFESVIDGKLAAHLKELRVNLLISINCNKRLRADVISLPEFGVLNIHNALLPAYRGLMPLVHAIANGEEKVGVTVHLIDEKLDNGLIVSQQEVSIEHRDNLFTLWERCVEVGARLLPTAVEKVVTGKVDLKKNGPDGASYFSFASPSQILKFRLRLLKKRWGW